VQQRADILLPGLLTAFGAVILWQSVAKMDYFYADRGAPGPGFLPFWVSLGIVVLGAILTVQAVRAGPPANIEWPDRLGWHRILYLIGGFLAFLLVIRFIGFTLASMLFIGVVSYLLGMRRWIVLLPVSVGVGLFLHLVFDTWLRISLPVGMLGENFQEFLPWIF
jgi:putative tricarboxylic transport membrane protein